MKRFSFKKPSKILAGVVLATTVLLSGCGGKEDRATSHLDKGMAYLSESNYAKAKLEFKNVLQIDPKFAKGYYYLGLTSEREQDWAAAWGAYNKAVELDPKYIAAKAKVGMFLLLSKQMDKAVEMSNEIVGMSPDDPDGMLFRANLAAKQNKAAEAKTLVQKVLDKHPEQEEAVLLAASLYEKDSEFDKSLAAVNAGLAKSPENSRLLFKLSEVYGKKGDVDKALEILKKLVEKEPTDIGFTMVLSRIYLSQKKEAEAEAALRNLIDADPKDVNKQLVLAKYFLERKGSPAAIEELKKMIAANSNMPELRFALAELLVKANDLAAAEAVYQETAKLEGTSPAGLKAKNAVATVYISQKKIDQAKVLLEEVLKENPTDSIALLVRAKLIFAESRYDDVIRDVQVVLKDKPTDDEALKLLASAYIGKGNAQMAADTTAKLVELHADQKEYRLMYAQLLMQQQRLDKALEQVEIYLKDNDADEKGFLTKAAILGSQNKLDEVEKVLDHVKQIAPKNPAPYFGMGRIYASRSQFDKSVQEFEKAISLAPDDLSPLTELVKVHIAAGSPEKGKELLQGLIKSKPESPVGHYLLGEFLVAQKDEAAAKDAFAKSTQVAPKFFRGYVALSSLYIKAKDTAGAVAVLDKGLAVDASNANLLFSKAQIFEKTEQFPEAIAIYRQMVSANTQNLIAMNNLVSLVSDHEEAKVSEMLQYAEPLLKADNQVFYDTVGWMYFKAKDYDKALVNLKKAAAGKDKLAIFHYHLGLTYKALDEKERAKASLMQAVELDANLAGAKQALAELQ